MMFDCNRAFTLPVPFNSVFTCVALSRTPGELNETMRVCVIKAFLLLSVVSLVSVCKTEEAKDDRESKADGGDDRDESSKVKIEKDLCLSFSFSFFYSLFLSLHKQLEIQLNTLFIYLTVVS